MFIATDNLQLATRLRTLRHLRGSQVLWRMRYTLERRRPLSSTRAARWAWHVSQAPRVRTDFPDVPLMDAADVHPGEAFDLLAAGKWRQLNLAQRIGCQQPDWQLGSRQRNRLWTVALHYHQWAWLLAQFAGEDERHRCRAAELLAGYLSDWLDRVSLDNPAARPLAWNAYAIATRIAWWIRTCRTMQPITSPAWRALEPRLLASLWQHAAYLYDHLEWDLRANHLLRDAVGLAWAGRWFAEPQARRWLSAATQVGLEQVREQVLSDGGHFERSPMYHLHVMGDIASLAVLVEQPSARDELLAVWAQMAEYAAWMRHPDRQIACFNDAAVNGSATAGAMLDLAEQLGTAADRSHRRGGRHFAASGHVVWHGDPWTVFFDVAPVGPDYQPGHAHADTLTVECSYGGQRLFVDPGTYAYDDDSRRAYDRSTAAHNTVTIDGANSSEVWHIFRLGRRAYPRGVQVAIHSDGLTATAAHDGYDHLPGRPQHCRTVEVHNAGTLRIVDRLSGSGIHRAEGGFLLAPGWQAAVDESGWRLSRADVQLRMQLVSRRSPERSVEVRPYHPEFGCEQLVNRLAWRMTGQLPAQLEFSISAD